LANVQVEEANKVTAAEGVVANKETAAAAAQANVDAKKADHAVKVDEQGHAQNAYDGAKPNLDSEQATLADVILMLKGLQATNDYTLEAQTGTTEYCDGGSISVQFKVDGLWTERLPFITSSEKGDTHEKIFSLASKPSAIQFHADDNDGWCYVEAHITKGHEESSVTFVEWGAADGPTYHSEGFGSWWTDGDDAAPVTNEYQVNWGTGWENGYCNEPSGADSQATQVSVGGTWEQGQCATKCNQVSDARGCEWNSSYKGCFTHGVEIGAGSGSGDYRCMPM